MMKNISSGGGFQQRKGELPASAYQIDWNSHYDSTRLAMLKYFNQKTFTDLTLASEDSTFECHRVVLSASSEYFEKILMKYEQRNPIRLHQGQGHLIILPTIKDKVMSNILRYIYNGSIKIAVDELYDFFETAMTLKIKGVHENHDVFKRWLSAFGVLPLDQVIEMSESNKVGASVSQLKPALERFGVTVIVGDDDHVGPQNDTIMRAQAHVVHTPALKKSKKKARSILSPHPQRISIEEPRILKSSQKRNRTSTPIESPAKFWTSGESVAQELPLKQTMVEFLDTTVAPQPITVPDQLNEADPVNVKENSSNENDDVDSLADFELEKPLYRAQTEELGTGEWSSELYQAAECLLLLSKK